MKTFPPKGRKSPCARHLENRYRARHGRRVLNQAIQYLLAHQCA